MNTNVFIPKEDVTERLPDGRNIMVVPAGRPITLDEARRRGLLDPVGPTEFKADADPPADPPEETEIDATKGAIEFANEWGVDLAFVEGTGANGRIVKHDVEGLVVDVPEVD